MWFPGNNCGLMTQEGPAAVKEAIEALKVQPKLPPFDWHDGMAQACADHCKDTGVKGITGHNGSDGSTPFTRMNKYGNWGGSAGENISYGKKTGEAIIMQLFVDDGVRSRGHRKNLQNAAFRASGLATGTHG